MIVDQSHGLHERIGRGRADKAPAPFLELFAQAFRSWGLGGDIGLGDLLRSFFCGRLKLPEECTETPEFFLKFQSPLSVIDGGFYLLTVSYDSSVEKQTFNVLLVKPGYLMKVEMTERLTEVLPFSEDGEPGESGLKALQADLFKQTLIVGNGVAPLRVVVVLIIFRLRAPPTAGFGQAFSVRTCVVHSGGLGFDPSVLPS